jgi:hypothetical protein
MMIIDCGHELLMGIWRWSGKLREEQVRARVSGIYIYTAAQGKQHAGKVWRKGEK